MARLCLPLLLLLTLVAPASAATLGEVPPLNLRGSTSCAGPTDTPGEVTAPTRTGVRFYTATRSGFQRRQDVRLGEHFSCQSVRTLPGGAGLIVGENGRTVVAVRDPGGAWSDPIDLSGSGSGYVEDITAALSERGDAVVAFKETRFGTRGDPETSQMYVARRAPGGAGFAPAEALGADSKTASSLQVGISATGEVIAVTGARAGRRVTLSVRVAPAGAGFGAPVTVGTTGRLSSPSLQVGPDGRALLAWTDGNAIRAAERTPGEGFGTPAVVGTTDSDSYTAVAARLADGGAAAVEWANLLDEVVQVVARPAPGAFSAATRIDMPLPGLGDFDPFYLSEAFFEALLGSSGTDLVFEETAEALRLTADGRVALAVAVPDGSFRAAMLLATVPLSGGAATVTRSRPAFTTSVDPVPLILADGTPAALWIEQETPSAIVERDSSSFRMRMAVEGAVPPAAVPAPRITVGAPLERTLQATAALRLPVTCSAACDVTITTEELLGSVPLSGFVHLRKAGRATLRIPAAGYLAGRRATPVRLHVAGGPRGTLYPRERTLTVRIAHAGPSLPRIASVRARRAGDRIRVEIAVKGDVSNTFLFVSGEDRAGWNGEPLLTRSVDARRSVSLTLPAREGLRYVAVRVPYFFGPGSKRVVRVR